MTESPLFTRLAAAYVRGRLGRAPQGCDPALFHVTLAALDERQLEALVALGRGHGLRLHRFKRSMGLPRVAKALGVLRGLAPSELLDIGSGRGAFLWPLLDAMPWLPVTALDTLAHRVADIAAVAAGGVARLRAVQGDITTAALPEGGFDVVTMLEVLEHIPDTAAALRAALRAARRFVVLSVPSRPDANPEHIHLFSAAQLERLCLAHGARRVRFDDVPGHLIAVASLPA